MRVSQFYYVGTHLHVNIEAKTQCHLISIFPPLKVGFLGESYPNLNQGKQVYFYAYFNALRAEGIEKRHESSKPLVKTAKKIFFFFN